MSVYSGDWGPGRTRADFYAQGERSARMGDTRSPGNEYRMPVFGEGRSWQARAFAQGFRDQCARMQRTVSTERG